MEGELQEYREGSTLLFVPRRSLTEPAPPMAPAFFNPHARVGRDVTVLLSRAIAAASPPPHDYLDAMAGVGARGLRVLVEGGLQFAQLNDLNPQAIELARRAARANGVEERCEFSVEEAAYLLALKARRGERFLLVDIDPFGSPAPYLELGLRAVRLGGALAFSATDTAALMGVHPRVAKRRYGGNSIRCEEAKEVAARLLLGASAMAAMRLEGGIRPLFVHATRHYVRAFVSFERGAAKADRTAQNIGYYHHCPEGLHRYASQEPEASCRSCGGRLLRAGPLWIGPLFDVELISRALSGEAGAYPEASRLLGLAKEEAALPAGYYTLAELGRRLRRSTPPLRRLQELLGQEGWRSARTSFEPTGLRTEAPAEALLRAALSSG
jgi:tRNA (guanine26-N2/guanine27-N2)-dimethyltransferase